MLVLTGAKVRIESSRSSRETLRLARYLLKDCFGQLFKERRKLHEKTPFKHLNNLAVISGTQRFTHKNTIMV